MKNAIKAVLRFTTMGILPRLFRASLYPPAWIARLYSYLDWKLAPGVNPQFFRHELNLYRWRFELGLWAFNAHGVFARERMFPDCKVLDLCCGDGSIAYLYFSDIAGRIDAVDRDAGAIAYAERRFRRPNLRFFRKDVLREDLPADDYDVVVWNAAISYFAESDIDRVLRKLASANRKKFELLGMAPRAYGYVDHKREFSGPEELRAFLKKYFPDVEVREIQEGKVRNMYFRARQA